LSEVDSRIINRALQIEDKRFYWHRGVDFLALARAIAINIKV
jgi:membrane carboxypeptidase/penicillin-binding protein PbpC